jgi:molecular chaperone HtpG
MLSNEKFAERAKSFFLYKNTDGKYFTIEEYENIIKENQKDKDDNLIHLYTNNKEEQFSFISAAKDKGYDVLLLESVLTAPLINKFEQEDQKKRFTRVDADVVDKLIEKEDSNKETLPEHEREDMEALFSAVTPKGEAGYYVTFEDLGANAQPMVITQNEFMRRMKDMSAIQGGMNMYGNLPDNYTVVANIAHPLVKEVIENKNKDLAGELENITAQLKEKNDEKTSLEKLKEGKKEEEIPQEEKEKFDEVTKTITQLETQKREKIQTYGKDNKLAKQLVDLALLANNMLKGEALDNFVKRSVDLIKK